MTICYATTGTCAKAIDIDIEGDRIVDVRFHGGCRGNSQGVAALVRGMAISDVLGRLQGIVCRNGTSCPDQLAKALGAADIDLAG